MLQNLIDNPIIVATIGQAVVTAVLVILTYVVYRYRKANDRLTFFHSNWNKIQDINIFVLEHKEVLTKFEKMVYGEDSNVEEQPATEFWISFLMLNIARGNYFAYKNGILSKKEYEQETLPILKLLVREKDLITYLLENRGYSDEFKKSILALLEKTDAPVLPESYISKS